MSFNLLMDSQAVAHTTTLQNKKKKNERTLDIQSPG